MNFYELKQLNATLSHPILRNEGTYLHFLSYLNSCLRFSGYEIIPTRLKNRFIRIKNCPWTAYTIDKGAMLPDDAF